MIATARQNHSTLATSRDVVSPEIRGNTTADLPVDQSDLWAGAIDHLLGWMSDDGSDRALLQSAIDFAWDQNEAGESPPSSIVVADDGEVAFEWRSGREIVTITILEPGAAEYTRWRNNRVVEEAILHRDPQTRKIQLRLEGK